MDTIGNVFVHKTYNDMLTVEREMICVYAESCFLSIQVIQGNLSCIDRLDHLAAELARAEQQLELLRRALHRIGVAVSANCHLEEQECIDLFQDNFTANDIAPLPLKGVFGRSDFQDMLNDIYPPHGSAPARGY